nr:unnamed protein product [Digitaria exilis]
MDNNEICKKPHEPEKLEIARRGEDKAFCNSEIEEGEFRKDIVASVIKPSPSVQMAFEKGQVNTRRSSSPERGSHQGGTGTANITVTQSGYSSIRGQPFNRQKIISECEAEMAECKRKFDEQFRILEMEALQKKKDIEILQEKVCRQQTLAETLQALHKASTGATSCSQREIA